MAAAIDQIFFGSIEFTEFSIFLHTVRECDKDTHAVASFNSIYSFIVQVLAT